LRIPRFVAITLAANFAFEFGAGLLMFVSPGSIFAGAAGQTVAVARTLATAAMAAGVMSLALLVAGENGRALRAALWVFLVFHVALTAVHGANALSHGYVTPTAAAGHAVMVVLFAIALLPRSRSRA
jgi:hypothetical protein